MFQISPFIANTFLTATKDYRRTKSGILYHMMQDFKKVDGELIESYTNENSKILRTRFQKEGYLYFRRYFKPSEIGATKIAAASICNKFGWLASDRAKNDLKLKWNFKLKSSLEKAIMEFAKKFSKSSPYRNLFNNIELRKLISRVLNEPVVCHPRRMGKWGRVHFPDHLTDKMTYHQDQFYLSEPQEVYSVWIPIGMVPRHLGGLAVLPKTHTLGLLRHTRANTKLAQAQTVLPSSFKHKSWLSTDYDAGDLLFMHSCLVHGPLPNRTTDTIRVSIDFRFTLKRLFTRHFLNSREFGNLD